jgi:hypothetical protein
MITMPVFHRVSPLSSPTFAWLRAGVAIFFMLSTVCARAAESPRQSFEVPAGAEVVLLTAAWENETTTPPRLRVGRPDGVFIDEKAFLDGAAARDPANARPGVVAVVDELSNTVSRTVLVLKPTPGRWTLALAEPAPALGKITFSAIQPDAPAADLVIEWIQPLSETAGGSRVEIAWRVPGAGPDLTCQLGYDDDRKDFNGIPITGVRREGDVFRATWDTAEIGGGTYHLDLSVMEVGRTGIIRSYAPGVVNVPHRARLTLDVTAPPTEMKPGRRFTTVAVIENTGSGTSGPVELAWRVPAPAKVAEIAPAPDRENGDWRIVRLAGVGPHSRAFVRFTLEAPAQNASLPLELKVRAADGEWTKDAPAAWSHTVSVAAETFVDLRVSRSALRGRLLVGQQADYTVTVVNSGTRPATDVTLREWVGNARILAATPSQGAASQDPRNNARAEIQLGALAAGAQAEIAVRVHLSAYGRQVTTSAVESAEPDQNPQDNQNINQDHVETAPDGVDAAAPAASVIAPAAPATPAVEAGGRAPELPTLLADGSFEDGGKGWRQTAWRPRPATIVEEQGNRFLQIVLPEGRSEDAFAPVALPPGCSAVKIRFRARCQINAEPAHPAIMLLFGTRESSKGKPVKLAVYPEWRDYEVVARFPANDKNNQFKITTVTSPLAVDIDDIRFFAATAEESAVPVPREGPGSRL